MPARSTLVIVIVAFVALTFGRPPSALATTIDFSEPQVTALLTHTFIGTEVLHYSDTLSSFSLDGVTFASSSGFVLRTTFDDRSPSPYSYDFISGNVLQAAGTGLNISFSAPTDTFSFGAAEDATFAPSQMQVQLFGLGNVSLGTFTLNLRRTALSVSGGTNSNSEGLFIAPSVGPITAAQLTNFGDGTADGSQVGWVIDNVTFQPVPEPMSLLLLGTGLVAGSHWRRQLRHGNIPPTRSGRQRKNPCAGLSSVPVASQVEEWEVSR
jgi:hypothetical protein